MFKKLISLGAIKLDDNDRSVQTIKAIKEAIKTIKAFKIIIMI